MPARFPDCRRGFALMELIAVFVLASILLAGISAVNSSLVQGTSDVLQGQQQVLALRSAAEKLDLCALSAQPCRPDQPERWQLSSAEHGCLLTDNLSELMLPVAGCRL